ncbi:hypothetical protein UFOVP1614_8 [uncultured Caudovirales phage]|uniref:Uncharacterized protein n=1 Tax=uncultured Caudovirales phage TaxID=2100421 RepID=A0A6J5SXK7_9CAUD|nr:hypothetical protein UFOVP508_14 [uncultured Caudovirales phage]CAB4178057.1 hypothetical protein UFOVP1012_21 [uncultured Caudovirales phage]CAB4187850.1 hypothetical protein UFOVP1164_16 [uncultured Caudovirales phage]CAB4219351.1 hypothetical protein UFOVP1614_8 [uncultured Caudovirales phage]
MNEQNLELAAQAGLQQRFDNPNEIWGYRADLERFAELVRADEREVCASLVEGYHPDSFFMGQVQDAANLIRARSEK